MANKPVEIVQLAGDAGKYKANLTPGNYLVRSFMGRPLHCGRRGSCHVLRNGARELHGSGIQIDDSGRGLPRGLDRDRFTGMSLFTGDTMLFPMAVFQNKSTGKGDQRPGLVYIGNFVGSLFWAYLMSVGPLSKGGGAELTAFGQNAVAIAQAKTLPYIANGGAGLWSAFMKGIACNLLVNLAILLALSSKNMIGKFFGIWFPIMAFVASGFEHSVANMYFIPTGIMLGANVTWGQFIGWNLIPVTLGNIVGGFVFIGAVYYISFKKELSSITPT